MNLLPDIFVIGAMKAGTTTFYNNYFNIPTINLTVNKEHNGFVRFSELDQIVDSYNGQFRRTEGARCDISPKYAQRHLFPDVAEKIFRTNPDARIIYLIRDPIERIYSHLYHDILRDRLRASDALTLSERQMDNYIQTSRYYHQISDYFRFFRPAQVLLVKLEDIRENRVRVAEQVGKFLNMPGFKMDKRISYSSAGRYKIYFHDAIHSMFGESTVTRAYHLFWKVMGVKPRTSGISSEWARHLRLHVMDDVNRLTSELRLNVDNWRYCGPRGIE